LAFCLSFSFAEDIYGFLVEPLANAIEDSSERRMIYTGLAEVFTTYLKVAFFSALILSSPFLVSQIWLFAAPGLYKKEKFLFAFFFMASVLLFLIGIALVYYLILPLAWNFFLGFEIAGSDSLPIQLEAKVNEYLSIVLILMWAFGITFQLPVVLSFLAKLGILDSKTLINNRKYNVIITFAIAAVLTPPDIISQIGLALPILLLYEFSIFLIKLIERKK
jgi:sec-independent protein translocase protein TatC